MFDLSAIGSVIAIIGAILTSNVKIRVRLVGFCVWFISNSMLLGWSLLVQNYWISLMYLCFLGATINGIVSHIKAKDIYK